MACWERKNQSSRSAILLLDVKEYISPAVQHCSEGSHEPPQSSLSPRVRHTTNPGEQIVLVPLAVRLDCLALPCLPILLLPCWMWSPERLLRLAVKSCRKKKKKWWRRPAEHFPSLALQQWFSCCTVMDPLDYLYKAYTGILMSAICWYLVMYRMQASYTSVFPMDFSPLGNSDSSFSN